ncbi:hypothetical protein MMO61_26235, partial [Escherichia coli]|nr:hypothetical protein [Escherichia coli]
MAAFIFDTGLNFSKENITKGVISTRWHNDLYSSFERMKAINKIYYPSNKEINTEGLSKAITSSLFNDDANSFAKRDFCLMWD